MAEEALAKFWNGDFNSIKVQLKESEAELIDMEFEDFNSIKVQLKEHAPVVTCKPFYISIPLRYN